MKNQQKTIHSSLWRRVFLWLAVVAALPILVACQPAVSAAPTDQPTATINPNFQSARSPVPTIPPYRCGAWASNNAPARNATIIIYARLTHNTAGVPGIQASATVHFQSGDFTIDQQATSDTGGYVSFTLNLQDRQPSKVPATVDVTFAGLPGSSLKCSAFFTPN
jgi:hypothetical protein